MLIHSVVKISYTSQYAVVASWLSNSIACSDVDYSFECKLYKNYPKLVQKIHLCSRQLRDMRQTL